VLYLEGACDCSTFEPDYVNLLYRLQRGLIIVQWQSIQWCGVLSLPFGMLLG